MKLADLIPHFPHTRKIRYGVVAAGHISQFAFMPAVAGTGNSEMTAIVTEDTEKALFLGKKYKIKHNYDYSQYDEFLKSGVVDAVYIALPNDYHKDFTIRALKAGIHVLLEKPVSILESDAKAIMQAAAKSKAKLMIAYRLHFEPATIEALSLVRSGKIGTARVFLSGFGQTVDPANHRAKDGYWAGPVADMGTYPINAVRNFFGAEPTEVSAQSINPNKKLKSGDNDTVAITLKFPGERIAQFTVSYSIPRVDWCQIIGDKGDLMFQSAFGYGTTKTQVTTIDEKSTTREFKPTSQFGGELQYFSDCILNNNKPEADAEEGYLDTRVIAAVKKSLDSGKPVRLEPYNDKRRITKNQVRKLSPVKPPKDDEMKNVKSPSIKKKK